MSPNLLPANEIFSHMPFFHMKDDADDFLAHRDVKNKRENLPPKTPSHGFLLSTFWLFGEKMTMCPDVLPINDR